MEKEQDIKINNKSEDKENFEDNKEVSKNEINNQKIEENKISSEEKVKELEEKLTRTLAEMENQRRRFEKEKDDAFEYGGFTLAKESLNLIDNFER